MIRDEYKDYTDSYGLVHPVKNPTPGMTQNGLRWTAEKIFVLALNGELTTKDKYEYQAVVKKCIKYRKLVRSPNNPYDQEGPDDYIATACALKLSNSMYLAPAIVKSGMETKAKLRDLKIFQNEHTDKVNKYEKIIKKLFGWITIRYNYNNSQTPDEFNTMSWMGRFPHLICALKWSSFVSPSPTLFERIMFYISILVTANLPVYKKEGGDNHDNHLFGFMLSYAFRNENFLTKLLFKYYNHKMKKKFPKGIKTALEEYFKNPDYPTVKFWPKEVKE